MTKTPQNQAEYDRACEGIKAFEQQVEELRSRIAAVFPNSSVALHVNTCTRGWKAGTPADYFVSVQLRKPDGSNVLCMSPGGKTPELAIRNATWDYEDFLIVVVKRAAYNEPFARAPYRPDRWKV